MSEYQYYEFRAIDRPLTDRDIAALRRLSSRAEITRTGFTNEYNYGDFGGNPNALMKKYFDASVYVTNWGTHQLMFRLPSSIINTPAAKIYCNGEGMKLRNAAEHVIFGFLSNEEGGGWEEGEGWLDSLIPLREDLASGDLRSLYLGWLAAAQSGELRESKLEPLVPPGLKKLTPALKSLVEFLRIDPELLQMAVSASPDEVARKPTKKELEEWIKELSEADKTKWLMRMAAEDPKRAQLELLRQFKNHKQSSRRIAPPANTGRRVRDLLAVLTAVNGD